MTRAVVVVGGGIAGLTAAWLLRQKYPSDQISVVERAPHLGGLLTTFDYGQFGPFDCGMHWMTETGVQEIDDLHFGLLPEKEWVRLEGSRRDLSGLFHSGKLQLNSQYPDLRELDRERYRACVADFFTNLSEQPVHPAADNLLAYARAQFGPLIADTVIAPIAAKVHGTEAESLDSMARYLPLLDRVVMFDKELSLDLMGSAKLRARIAFPEQRELPLSYSSGRHSRYPRRYGIGRVIDALAERLRAKGVELLTNAQVRGITRGGSQIDSVEIKDAQGVQRVFNPVQQLVWTADAFALAGLLGLPLPQRAPPRRRTVIVSLLLKSPPRMGDLYCLFCADAPHSSYRITNFSAFCPEAPRAGGYPICVELLVDWAKPPDQAACAAQAIQEVVAMGLVASGDEVLFARAESLLAGFPSISCNSIKAVELLRDTISAAKTKNLIRGGILAKKNQFFQHDVLKDLHAQIGAL